MQSLCGIMRRREYSRQGKKEEEEEEEHEEEEEERGVMFITVCATELFTSKGEEKQLCGLPFFPLPPPSPHQH